MLADDHPLRRLAEQYPACFNLVGHERKPIKIGIGHELAVLDTGLTPLQLSRALATYVRHSGCGVSSGASLRNVAQTDVVMGVNYLIGAHPIVPTPTKINPHGLLKFIV
jgi:ProQ/FINO family